MKKLIFTLLISIFLTTQWKIMIANDGGWFQLQDEILRPGVAQLQRMQSDLTVGAPQMIQKSESLLAEREKNIELQVKKRAEELQKELQEKIAQYKNSLEIALEPIKKDLQSLKDYLKNLPQMIQKATQDSATLQAQQRGRLGPNYYKYLDIVKNIIRPTPQTYFTCEELNKLSNEQKEAVCKVFCADMANNPALNRFSPPWKNTPHDISQAVRCEGAVFNCHCQP